MKRYLEYNNKLNIPVNGVIQLEEDKKAVEAFFKDHVNTKSRRYQDMDEQLRFLIDNDFIDESVINQYPLSFIEQLSKELYAVNFRFKTFMGAYKAYKQYILKDDDLYLEFYEDRILLNALLMGNGDQKLARVLAMEMIHQRYQPATPTFLSAGRKHRGEFVSCFLLKVEDNMNSIGRLENSALQLSKIGGGVGIDLSNLREQGSPIKNIKGAASGVIPVAKMLETTFNYANQLGQRNGAGVVYLNIFHTDILDFLSTKNENAEASKQLKTLSLGVVLPDIYYQLVENDEIMYLISAYDASRYYQKPFSEINFTEEYYNIIENNQIKKTAIKAKDLSDLISKLQQESGYPFVMNIDKANEVNPIHGKITMSNLCTEIFQVQEDSVINDDQSYAKLGKDISCNLGSINIPNFMNKNNAKNAENSVEAMVRALTYISDISHITTVPTVDSGNRRSHSIGLGAMGLHEMLATHFIKYGEKESIEFVDKFFEMINYLTLKASNRIAQERNEQFDGFEKSTYFTGEYFDTYLTNDHDSTIFNSPKIKEIFFGFPLPTRNDWLMLKDNVKKYGLYNQNRMAIAPTGSISYVNETTASLHPITSLVEGRQEKKVGKVYYPAPGLTNDTLPYYEIAYNISMLKVIDVYAAAQKHIDQGISLTLFMKSTIPEGLYPWKPNGGSMSTKDLTLIRHYAWKKGLKSIYYVRTHTDDGDEVGVNECESCSI